MIVECAGDARAIGRAHGEGARALIQAGLERWRDAVGRSTGIPVSKYVPALVGGTGLMATTQRILPDLVTELEGIAEGADADFGEIAAYNLMDEQWWFDAGIAAVGEPGCSVIGARLTDSGTVLAQNMDLPGFMDGSQLMLHIHPDSGPAAYVLTAAGMVGLTGMNSAGLGVCVNTLLMLNHRADGLPVAAVLRGLLACQSLAEAERFLTSVPHASGQHYALADRTGLRSFECSAAGASASAPAGADRVLHTNHPLASRDLDPAAERQLGQAGRIDNSRARHAFLAGHASQAADAASVRTVLEDRTVPICVTPEPGHYSITFGSVLYLLGDQQAAEYCLGRPDASAWQQVPAF